MVLKLILSILSFALVYAPCIIAQNTPAENIGEQMAHERESNFRFGGYAQLDYNQQFDKSTRYNGKLDPHRFVLFVGYQFSKQIHLVSELELEHGNEIYLEQAFVNYNINPLFQLRGGVMLIPMGITNEYHEPVTFNGVERPSISNIIIPTTWREMGVGFHGRINSASLKYQAYAFNGFNGYDSEARFNGKNGLRAGRQKAINSYISSPNFSIKFDYYGIDNLNIGLAGYFGKSQSKLYDKLDTESDIAVMKADSSVIGLTMIGLDARYKIGGLELRGEYIYSAFSNTSEYNAFNKKTDLGSCMTGAYAEIAYNVFHDKMDNSKRLVPFVRYENYNTHSKTDGIAKNKAYNIDEWIAGIGFQPTSGVVFKADYQTKKSKADDTKREYFINCGIGLTF